METLRREIRSIIATALRQPVDQVPVDAPLEAGLGIDSMAMIEINVMLEQRYNVRMADMASPSDPVPSTIEDLVQLVASELAKASRAT